MHIVCVGTPIRYQTSVSQGVKSQKHWLQSSWYVAAMSILHNYVQPSHGGMHQGAPQVPQILRPKMAVMLALKKHPHHIHLSPLWPADTFFVPT